MGRTQEQRKADTRGRLLSAAAGLFAAQGIDGVSVDAVADAADRTSGAVYAHFGSKQGLLLALLDEGRHSLAAVILAEFELTRTVPDRLRSVATNLIVEPSEETRRLLLLEQELWLRASRDPEVAAILEARARESQRWLTRGFQAWIDEGIIPATEPPEALATAFRAMVTGLGVHHRIDPTGLTVETATAALAASLGLPAPSPTTV